MKQRNILFALALILSAPAYCRDVKDLYKKADNYASTYGNKLYNTAYKIENIRETPSFLYYTNTPSGKTYYLVDAEKQTKSPAFDHEKLAQSMSAFFNDSISRDALPFGQISFNKELDIIKFTRKNAEYECSLADYQIKKAKDLNNRSGSYWGSVSHENRGQAVNSPDKKMQAYISEGNLWIKNMETGKTKALSSDGSPMEYYSSKIYWSPDSKKIACCKYRPVDNRKLTLTESSPKDQLQPKVWSIDYVKPGDALPIRQPVLFDVEKETSTLIEFPEVMSQYDLNIEQWNPDSDYFIFSVNKRGHQEYLIYRVDAKDGKRSTLVHEQSPTFFRYSDMYRHYLPKTQEMIWLSERDGWRHLYLYDMKTGKVIKPLTQGEWVVKSVIRVDEDKREILLKGCGKDKGEDPYLEKYYIVNMNTGKIKGLTPENANHQVTFSSDYHYLIDSYSRIDLPPTTVLRSASDGKILLELEKADITEMQAAGWKAPEVFTAKGRDGKTDIWGMIIRPSDYDPNKKYPVIEYIYAGPHDSFVPKSFSPSFSYSVLAELGFIIVQCDGMGTANRSKAFHDVCWKNLKDAGFPDRIAWMKAAAAKYPEMDLDRVGIFGTSAGGQSSTAGVLFHPEFYKVAVSACGCHDNRMDKIWWNEQWMGYPIGPHYEESSNVCNAHRLQGQLMLIVGEIDDNVDPASTYQLADALMKADKEFELVMITGVGHTGGLKYGERKRRDFFVKHLLGIDPPEWNK